MKEDIKFSVITPAYNRGELIGKAIQSLLDQSYSNWEMVIIDDGSIDNTREVVESFEDPRIKYHYQDNQERSIARNNGISKATGEFICFLDSDDYYLPEHLATFAEALQKQDQFRGLLYADGYLESGDNRKEVTFSYNPEKHPANLAFHSFFSSNGVCAHRSVFEKDLFYPQMKVMEDVHLWLRILMKHPFIYIPEYTSVVVDHEGRGGTEFFAKSDKKSLDIYLSNVEDLFFNHGLGNYVSQKEWNDFRIKRYYTFAFNNAWKKEFKEALKLMAEIIKTSPRQAFTKRFLKLKKEFAVSLLR